MCFCVFVNSVRVLALTVFVNGMGCVSVFVCEWIERGVLALTLMCFCVFLFTNDPENHSCLQLVVKGADDIIWTSQT